MSDTDDDDDYDDNFDEDCVGHLVIISETWCLLVMSTTPLVQLFSMPLTSRFL